MRVRWYQEEDKERYFEEMRVRVSRTALCGTDGCVRGYQEYNVMNGLPLVLSRLWSYSFSVWFYAFAIWSYALATRSPVLISGMLLRQFEEPKESRRKKKKVDADVSPYALAMRCPVLT
eukprot:3291791-Rhodomonas_salina.2